MGAIDSAVYTNSAEAFHSNYAAGFRHFEVDLMELKDGNLVAFRRSENSYHGHLPYEGERRVIQIAWLTSDEEKLRKARRGRLSRLFKKWFGAIDRHIGAARKDDASHLD